MSILPNGMVASARCPRCGLVYPPNGTHVCPEWYSDAPWYVCACGRLHPWGICNCPDPWPWYRPEGSNMPRWYREPWGEWRWLR